jgi:hypothetical protein
LSEAENKRLREENATLRLENDAVSAQARDLTILLQARIKQNWDLAARHEAAEADLQGQLEALAGFRDLSDLELAELHSLRSSLPTFAADLNTLKHRIHPMRRECRSVREPIEIPRLKKPPPIASSPPRSPVVQEEIEFVNWATERVAFIEQMANAPAAPQLRKDFIVKQILEKAEFQRLADLIRMHEQKLRDAETALGQIGELRELMGRIERQTGQFTPLVQQIERLHQELAEARSESLREKRWSRRPRDDP